MAKIQIVEDEAFVALDIQETLLRLGHDVTAICASAEEAIRAALADRPDLILMDVSLTGDTTGIEAAEQISHFLDSPIIFLTAYSDSVTIDRMKPINPAGYILKPYNTEMLRATIDLALHKHNVRAIETDDENRLLITLRSIGDAVITTDEQGIIEFMNPAAEGLTGWTLVESLGQDINQIFHLINDATQTPAWNPVTHALSHGRIAGTPDRTSLAPRSGTFIPISCSAAPILHDDNTILGVVIVFRDVTHQRQLTSLLMQTQRLESVAMLAGGIAHDFNNLLTGILAQSSLLQTHTDSESWAYKRIERIIKAAERATDLTSQLLQYAGKSAVLPSMIDLGRVIEETEGQMRQIFTGDVQLTLNLATKRLPIVADPLHIKQVLMNLVRNSWQATQLRSDMVSHIKICTLLNEISDKSRLALFLSSQQLQPGNYAELIVIDNGIGMDTSTRARIFDPFYSNTPERRGLGMAVTLGILKRFGGGIRIESTPNSGTVVTVLFPLAFQSSAELPKTLSV